MNLKVHYLVTFCALVFLGVIISNPRVNAPSAGERSCKMVKGKMDCVYKYTEYRINKNTDVQYRLN